MAEPASNEVGDAPAPQNDSNYLRRAAKKARAHFEYVLAPLRSIGRTLWPMYSSVEEVRKFSVNLLVLIGVLLGAAVIAKASSKSYVTIDPIMVPKQLADRGFTGEVVAQRIHDEILQIGVVSKMNNPIGEFSTFSFERTLPKIELPIGGMSLGSVVTSLRDFVGFVDTKIGGELTVDDDSSGQSAGKKKYLLRLRITDKGAVYSPDEPIENLDELIRRAALKVVERFDPHIAAAYYYSQKQYDNALRMVHLSLNDRTSKNDAAALNLRGMIAKEQQLYDAALATFNDVRKRFSKEPQALQAMHNITATLLLKGDYAAAWLAAYEGVDKDPKQPAAYLAAGSVLYSLRLFDAALPFFKKSVELDSSSAVGYLNQAAVYIVLPQPDHAEALSMFQRAADADPRDERVFINWGMLLRQRGSIREARAVLERAVEVKPDSPRGYQQLGLLLLDEYNWQKAEERLRKALSFDQESPYIRHDLGCALLYGGRLDDAADEFRKAIAGDEKFALAHIKLAATLAEMVRLMKRDALLDRPSEAEESIVEIKAVTDDILDLIDRAAALAAPEAKGDILRESGRIHEVLERYEDAVEAYRNAIGTDEKRNAGLAADIDRLGRRIAAL